MTEVQDPVMQQLQAEMQALQQTPEAQVIFAKMMEIQAKAEAHELSLIPSFPVKVKGFKRDSKELLAQVEGDFKLDWLLEAIRKPGVAAQYLLDGRDRAEAGKISRQLGRVLLVIDCMKPEDPKEAPKPPSAPPPSGGSPILMAA